MGEAWRLVTPVLAAERRTRVLDIAVVEEQEGDLVRVLVLHDPQA